VLMLGGITEILLITTESELPRFKELLGDGSTLGLSISYEIQYEPKGIADALIIGSEFIGNDDVTLILGDNIYYGKGFTNLFRKAIESNQYTSICGYRLKYT